MAGKSKKTATSAPEEVITAGQEALQDFIKTNQQAYQKVFGNTQEQMTNFVGNYAEYGDDGKAGVDALVQAGQTYAKGVETLTAEWFAFSKSMIEANVAVSKDAFAANNLNDAVELHTAHIHKTTDEFMAQSAKVGEMGSKILQDTVAPINTQVTATMQKVSDLAA